MPAVLQNVTKISTDANSSRETASEKYHVLYDIPDVSAVTARDAAGLPAYNAAHADNSALTVHERQARRIGRSGLFEVEVRYKINTGAEGGDRAIHPLSRPTQDRMYPLVSQVEVDTTAAETLIKNSAGQPQKTSIQWGDIGLSYTKNEASLNTGYSAYFFRTNTATFKGFAIGQVLCTGISQEYAEEIYRGAQVVYYKTTYNFAVALERITANPANYWGAGTPPVYWQARLLDAGTMEKRDNKLTPIVDGKTGSYVSSPVNLDGAGLELSTTGTPLWGLFTVYGSANFAALGI